MKKIVVILIISVVLVGCGKSVDEVDINQNDSMFSAITETEAVISTATTMQTSTPTETPTPSPTLTSTPEPQLLSGYRIGIDPGHQSHANDEMERISPYNTKEKKKVALGTKGKVTGVREYVFNLELAFLLKAALEAQGAEVFLTRETHHVDISNMERAKMVNDAECDFWIRIHANWNEDENKVGISTLTPKEHSVSTYIYEESKLLSGLVQKNLIEVTGAYDHGLSYRSTITSFCWSRIPVTLIECGYMSNADEDILLQTEYYQDLLVEGIVRGMIDYVNGEEFPLEYEYVPR